MPIFLVAKGPFLVATELQLLNNCGRQLVANRPSVKHYSDQLDVVAGYIYYSDQYLVAQMGNHGRW